MGMSGDDGCSFLPWRSLGHSRDALWLLELSSPTLCPRHALYFIGRTREGFPEKVALEPTAESHVKSCIPANRQGKLR